jgi:hypothetical protein
LAKNKANNLTITSGSSKMFFANNKANNLTITSGSSKKSAGVSQIAYGPIVQTGSVLVLIGMAVFSFPVPSMLAAALVLRRRSLFAVPRPIPAAPRRYLIVMPRPSPAAPLVDRRSYLVVAPRPTAAAPRRYLAVAPRP